ncbi:MAG: cysteine-rich CWC family protein [Burkholderia sp.]
MPRSATAVPASRRCPRCATAFDCGAGAPEAPGGAEPFACWCAALPPLAAPAGRCLCPECLAGALARQAAAGAGIEGQGDPTE